MEFIPFAEWTAPAEIEGAPVARILPQLRRMSPFLPRTAAQRFATLATDEGIICPAIDRELTEAFVRRIYRAGWG